MRTTLPLMALAGILGVFVVTFIPLDTLTEILPSSSKLMILGAMAITALVGVFLPIAVGGVGVREGTAVLLLRSFGIAEAAAFNAFFIHFVIVQLIPALVGALLMSSGSGGADPPGRRCARRQKWIGRWRK